MLTPYQKGIVKKWLKALRSGKYKQTKKVLRSKANGYCCLGVLCDVVAPKGWDKKSTKDLYTKESFRHNFDDGTSEMILPSKFHTLTGLGQIVNELAVMNDDGKKFSTIANYIEEHAAAL